MTRRYTRETPARLADTTAVYAVVRLSDGTTSEGNTAFFSAQGNCDNLTARMLPVWIANGHVTPVPVDLKREAAKFARGKRKGVAHGR